MIKKKKFVLAMQIAVRILATPMCSISRRAQLGACSKHILSTVGHKLNYSGHILIWTVFFFCYVQMDPQFCPQLSVTSCISVTDFGTRWNRCIYYNLPNNSSLAMTVRLTQPLTETNIRNHPGL
jgi:hypothetical protein